jgi:hemerythrin
MSLFEWQSVYSVGDPRTDAQHQQLFDIANRFHRAYQEGRSPRQLSTIFSELIDYTKYHFADEERLMRQAGYPDFDKHKENHDRLVELVGAYCRSFERGDKDVAENAMTFIKTWLTGHILGMDRKYRPYLEETRH